MQVLPIMKKDWNSLIAPLFPLFPLLMVEKHFHETEIGIFFYSDNFSFLNLIQTIHRWLIFFFLNFFLRPEEYGWFPPVVNYSFYLHGKPKIAVKSWNVSSQALQGSVFETGSGEYKCMDKCSLKAMMQTEQKFCDLIYRQWVEIYVRADHWQVQSRVVSNKSSVKVKIGDSDELSFSCKSEFQFNRRAVKIETWRHSCL